MGECSTVIGMDLGDRMNHYCMLDGSGEVVSEGRVACTEAGLRGLFSGMERALVAVEAGTHSRWVSSLLEELGHRVLVGNARKLRAIYQNERKCDERDAEMLARIARVDPKLLHPIRHRGDTAQADLAVLKARDVAVHSRTQFINHVRGTVKTFGHRLPKCSTASFHHKVGEAIPEALRAALMPVLKLIAELTQTIRDYDGVVAKRCTETYPETAVLRSVPGVGPVTALAYVLTLEEADRFTQSRNVPAFFGLVPRRDQSGDSDKQLRITKTGNRYLRRLLVGAAHYILGHFGPDSHLRDWGLKLAERGGGNGKKRAVVAVARKLAVLLHRLWTTGMVYEPFPGGAPTEATATP